MRGKLVAGKQLIITEAAARRWIKKTSGWYNEPLPTYYPCLATAPFGADENAYTHYEYLIDVENMLDALLEARESVPTDKQQPYAVRYAHAAKGAQQMYDKRNCWNNWFVFSGKRAIAMCTKELDADTIVAALKIAETGNISTNSRAIPCPHYYGDNPCQIGLSRRCGDKGCDIVARA
jgi:hypothetical protein